MASPLVWAPYQPLQVIAPPTSAPSIFTQSITHTHTHTHTHTLMSRMCPPSLPETLILWRVITAGVGQSGVICHTHTHTHPHTHTDTQTQSYRQRHSLNISSSPLPLRLSLSLTLALLDTPAVIPVFLTDYSSCSSYRSPPSPQPANKSPPDKTLTGPGAGGRWCWYSPIIQGWAQQGAGAGGVCL